MATRGGRLQRAIRIAEEDEARVRLDLGRARRACGLGREDVGRACGMSRSTIERIEAGIRSTTLREYAAIGAAVATDVRMRAYSAGDPIRDAGQQRLLVRLRVRLHRDLDWRTEVPLPGDLEQRAWDAVIRGRGWHLAVEVETVIEDVQALERRLTLKRRDGQAARVLLLVAGTRRNRRALDAAPSAFADLAGDARAVLGALGEGRDPGASAVILL
jgi:transcriptional regulator with XRE-family HTH domain